MKHGFIRQILNWISSNSVFFENDTLNGKSYCKFLACFRSAADRPRILNKCYLSVYLYCGMGRLKYARSQRQVVTRYGYLEKKIFPKYM